MDWQITSKLGSSLLIGPDMTNLQGGDYSNIVGVN
jgi:hypothetical protein